jgi:hypothetical protein
MRMDGGGGSGSRRHPNRKGGWVYTIVDVYQLRGTRTLVVSDGTPGSFRTVPQPSLDTLRRVQEAARQCGVSPHVFFADRGVVVTYVFDLDALQNLMQGKEEVYGELLEALR